MQCFGIGEIRHVLVYSPLQLKIDPVSRLLGKLLCWCLEYGIAKDELSDNGSTILYQNKIFT